MTTSLLAQVFEGGGVGAGIGAAGAIGVSNAPIRDTIVNILLAAVNLVALLAVIAIVVGGIYLIAGMGTEESRERAKRIIIYTIVGLFVILLVRVIVGFVTNLG